MEHTPQSYDQEPHPDYDYREIYVERTSKDGEEAITEAGWEILKRFTDEYGVEQVTVVKEEADDEGNVRVLRKIIRRDEFDATQERVYREGLSRKVGNEATDIVLDEFSKNEAVVAREMNGRNGEYYKALFSSAQLDDSQSDFDKAHMQHRLLVTAESEADAKAMIGTASQKDMFLDGIIKSYAGELDEPDIAKLLRENNELRTKVGVYLLKAKMPCISKLPERMSDRFGKNPNYHAYPHKMDSKEYATVIALSMLDGTFKASDTLGDEIEIRNGVAVLGQHRFTAYRLLGVEVQDIPGATYK